MRLRTSKHSTEAANALLLELFVRIMSADARVVIKNPRELKDTGRRRSGSEVFWCAVCFLRLLFPKRNISADQAFVKRDLHARCSTQTGALGKACYADQTGALLGVLFSSINR